MSQIDLPIQGKKIIGTIDLNSSSYKINNDEPVSYQCQVTGDCCRRHQVPILDHEIQRLKNAGYDNFLSDLPPVDSPEGETHWIKREDSACIFLKDNKCSIHKIKPFSCKLYPFNIRPFSDDNSSFRVIIPVTNTCPEVRNTSSEKGQNEEFLNFILNLLVSEKKLRS